MQLAALMNIKVVDIQKKSFRTVNTWELLRTEPCMLALFSLGHVSGLMGSS